MRVFLELTAAVHIANLLCGGSAGAVSCAILSRALLSTSVLVNDHALSACGILLGRRTEALVISIFIAGFLSLHTRLLADNVQHRVLERLLVFAQTVLLPGVIEDAVVEVVPLHAALEIAEALAIVGLLLELQSTAVLHELAELARVAATELFQASLNLLLLDVVVLLVLGASREALPWELAFNKVEQNVTDGFEIVTAGLLDALVSCD